MKKLSLILLFSLGALSAFAQQRITLDLQQTIALANDSSLEAFRTKNMYLAGYWEYRTYKANRLPSLTLNMTPAQYNRDITKRYDSEQDLDIYRSQQSFYAYGNLAVRQNFDLTGGTFYLDTELGYMRSFGGNKYTQFTSVPVRLGYSQSLVGYNPFRWERRIEPLKYEKVKKEYIYNAERVSEQATTYFFALAMAQAEYDLAKDNAVSTDTLYRIGMQRLKIAAISRAEVFTTFRLFLAMLYLPFLTPQSTSGMETLTDTISCCMGCLYASPNFSATWLKPTLALMLALKRDSFFVLSTVCSASSTS